MKSIHSLKKQLEVVAKEIKEIKKIATDTSFEVSHEDLLNEVSGKQEFQTISYLLGKTLIDSKSGVSAVISTPRKLYLIYKLSKDKKSKLAVTNLEVESKKINNNLVPVKNIIYNNIENFLEQSITKDNGIIDITGSKDVSEIFGLKKNQLINIIDEKKLFIENANDITIYVKSESFINVCEHERKANLKLFFNIHHSKNIEIQVLLECYGLDKSTRIDYKLLPLNKKLNVEISKDTNFLRFGLRIKGEGFIRFDDIFIKQDLSPAINTSKPLIDVTVQKELEEGVSIIIPSYQGQLTILDTLNSILNQKNIDLKFLEVLVIINGKKDNTKKLVTKFMKQHPELRIKLSSLNKAGASYARNYGIKLASKKYTIFCDDDDMLSEEYLAGLYSIADLESVGFCRIHDLTEQGVIIEENSINNNLELAIKYDSKDITYFTSAITMMASKIIPTNNLKQIKFNEELRSGEDVVFFTEYFVRFNPKINITINDKASYIRRLRANSVSRQVLSFDFNVTQRLKVINDLLKLITPAISLEKKSFINSKVYAQCGFIVKYLKEYPEEYPVVHSEIMKLNISNFPYRYLQDKLSLTSPELLVISYCHPPFVDTSSVVTAKRVYEFNEMCDVVCADMSKVRSISKDLVNINRHLVRDSYVVNLVPSFGNWKGITEFTKATIDIVGNKHYEKVYSRSFWPASHFAAFEYKKEHPNVKWIAEFSDPVWLDIEGKPRYAKVSSKWVEKTVSEFNLEEILLKENNLYVWCELLVYLMADEIIFTCNNQLKLMTESFPYKTFLHAIIVKSKVLPHPTLPRHYYENVKTKYVLNKNYINFAYFGAFYSTRKLDELLDAVRLFVNNSKSALKKPVFHIFTEQIKDAEEMIKAESLTEYFIINPYVDYLEFLNICQNMDVLIVNDARAKDIFTINPYLPSKISDYLGSETDIWSFYEPESALDKCSGIRYRTEIGKNQAYSSLMNIIHHYS